MKQTVRQRHYVSGVTLLVAKPLFRYSRSRDAHVLRVIGNQRGPVLRRERRKDAHSFSGIERRRGERSGLGPVASPSA